MDIFEKRERILDLQEEMLTGNKTCDNDFLALVRFENCLCNSGLAGFAQDIDESDFAVINAFATQNDFAVIRKMISMLQKYKLRYGDNFIDCLTESEYRELSGYDEEFYDFHDHYTNAIHNKYLD